MIKALNLALFFRKNGFIEESKSVYSLLLECYEDSGFLIKKISVSRQDHLRDRNKNPKLDWLIKHWYNLGDNLSRSEEKWYNEQYRELEDLGEVALGDKPAALLFSKSIIFKVHRELANYLIKLARDRGHDLIQTKSLNNLTDVIIIGRPENIRAIHEEIMRVNSKSPTPFGAPKVDRQYHETLGRNLGFSEEDIQEFINEVL